ncbi:MAG: tetratricopeptide repeat protein [Candidatus Zambryskibacteria bacterium]|nr:tetratricopeptide repeat protein [Candidatus Zambryskibacteria bacterium]
MEENNIYTKSSVADKITFGLLLLVVFLAPLFFVPGSFVSVQFGTSLLFAFGTIVSIFAFIISSLKKGTLEMPESKLFMFGALLAVPGIYTLASLSHGFSRMSFFGYTFDLSTVGFILLGFAFLFLVSNVFKTRERIFYSYVAVVVSLLSVTIFLVIRMIFGANVLSFGLFNELTSTAVGGWNSTGIFFGIGAILSLFTFEMLSLTKLTRALTLCALVASLFFLSLVNFSTIWVIVAVTAFLFLAYRVFSSDDVASMSWGDRLKKIPVTSFIVFIVALVFTIWGGVLGNKLATAFNVSSVDVRPTLGVTLDIVKNTLKNQPVFGSGPNTFASQWLSYKPADINSTIFWNTDFAYGVGLLPTFAVTTGILGVLSWIFFFAVFLYLGFKAIFSKMLDQFSLYLTVSSFFIALYLWIMTFIYVPSMVVFILTLFFTGLFFATLYTNGVLKTKVFVFTQNPKVGFAATLALVAVFVVTGTLAYGLMNNSRSLWYFQKSAYAANTKGDIADSEVQLAKAIALVPYDVYYRAQSEIAILKINSLLSQDLSKANKEEVSKFFTDELSKAISSATKAQQADDANYLNWVALGRAYEVAVPSQTEVAGAYEAATLSYQKAMERNPQNPGISLLFARLEAAKNNLKKAKEYAFLAINQKQNYTDAYLLLSQLEVADKNLKGAIDSVAALAIIDPTNANVFFQLGLLKYNDQDFKGATEAFVKSLTIAPDYANSKYFLGLSLVQQGDIPNAIKLFEELKTTNPESKEVEFILTNLKAGKSPFTNAEPPITSTPEKRQTAPVRDRQ